MQQTLDFFAPLCYGRESGAASIGGRNSVKYGKSSDCSCLRKCAQTAPNAEQIVGKKSNPSKNGSNVLCQAQVYPQLEIQTRTLDYFFIIRDQIRASIDSGHEQKRN
jgi:hypothetical protein